jgi:hypothetical protein
MVNSLKKALPYHLVLMVSLSLLAGAVSLTLSGMMSKKVTDPKSLDLWFDADTHWVYDNMSNLNSEHRTKRHPLFSIVTWPVVKVLSIVGIPKLLAVRIVLAIIAAIWIAAVYTIILLITGSLFNAFTFSMLSISSASFFFWASVPETWLLGSLTILLALLLVAAKDHIKHIQSASFLVSLLTLGITISNWMAGIVATVSLNGLRKGMRITLSVFFIILILSVIQKMLFRTDGLFLKQGFALAYVHSPIGELSDKSRAILWHSIIMPEISIRNVVHPDGAVMKTMSVQRASAGSGTGVGILAVVIWNVLLALGIFGFSSSRSYTIFRICFSLILLGQMLLYSVINTEVFVYAAHYSVLLIFLSSWATATRWRTLSLVLTWALIIFASINNWKMFLVASKMYKAFPG